MISEAYVILDANILLHYQAPDQIDWRRLAKSQTVHLVIYPRLRSEVSNAKDMHPVKAIRSRAAQREPTLMLARPRQPAHKLREGVFLLHDADEQRALYPELGLDRAVHDDVLIAMATAYQRMDRNVFVCTADGGLQMKCDDREIPFLALDPDLRLQAEPDRDKAKIGELEREVRRLRDRQPDFLVKFAEEPLPVIRQATLQPLELYVQERMTMLRAAYEQQQRPRPGHVTIIRHFESFSQEVQMARSCVSQDYVSRTDTEQARRFRLKLQNVGSRPATQIRLLLHPPEYLNIGGSGQFGQPPQLPGYSHPIFDALRIVLATPPADIHNYVQRVDMSGYARRNKETGTVEANWSRLQHRDETFSQEVWVVAKPTAPIGSVRVGYEVICNEKDVPATGHIEICIAN